MSVHRLIPQRNLIQVNIKCGMGHMRLFSDDNHLHHPLVTAQWFGLYFFMIFLDDIAQAHDPSGRLCLYICAPRYWVGSAKVSFLIL